MRILVIHNKYRDVGGEDLSVDADVSALSSRGHSVYTYFVGGRQSPKTSYVQSAFAPWNPAAASQVAKISARVRPDVVHLNNTWPLLSPAAYFTAGSAAPLVVTLRNYRYLCAKGTLYRDGGRCTECVESRFSVPAVKHRCYRESRVLSALAGATVDVNRSRQPLNAADAIIALSDSHKEALERYLPKLIPPIYRRYNITRTGSDGALDPEARRRGDFVTFVGRDAPGKGLSELLEAWAKPWKSTKPTLQLIGPPADYVAQTDVVCLGELRHDETMRYIAASLAVVIPSTWDEPFGRSAAEALSTGTPIIAGRGGPAEHLSNANGRIGARWDPIDEASSLEAAVMSVRTEREQMSRAALTYFQQHLSVAALTRQLEDIYAMATAASAARTPR